MQSEQTRDRKGEVFIQSQRLVARSSPEADESLYGWAVRLADANGYPNARAILSLAKRGASAPSAGILSNRLAQLVGGSPSDFERYVAAHAIGPSYHGLELGVGASILRRTTQSMSRMSRRQARLEISVEFTNLALLPSTFLQIDSDMPFLLQSPLPEVNMP